MNILLWAVSSLEIKTDIPDRGIKKKKRLRCSSDGNNKNYKIMFLINSVLCGEVENEIRNSKPKYISWAAKWYRNERKKIILCCNFEITSMHLDVFEIFEYCLLPLILWLAM